MIFSSWKYEHRPTALNSLSTHTSVSKLDVWPILGGNVNNPKQQATSKCITLAFGTAYKYYKKRNEN